ncbi:amidohydrolase [Parendozoicomonas haliclonae]|uniref:N-substituted formamide deformylase n=1 Tax=Parendozoicomonas haliclonae TaxID=1960125 RepID=A0A1X7AK91_9GAMM|nr:amidohydrolase [Parendozoicomonas haliclonae]SMA47034.1 N-substituted formamide deformylase precursor [Parendozoicomonas haliclonae]
MNTLITGASCKRLFASVAILSATLCLTACQSISTEVDTGSFADAVYTDARIKTMDTTQPWAEALAIKDGQFVAVGSQQDISRWIGPQTDQKHLDNKLVLPGLIDSHTHPGLVSFLAQVAPMPDEMSHDNTLAWLADYAADNPELPIIMGGVWDAAQYGVKGPHKKDLDAIVNDRPVILMEYWGHSVWVNSKALEAMGVDDDTPDPVPGVSGFIRDEKGEATGWVTEFAAMPYLFSVVKTNDNFEMILELFLESLSSYGVTSLLDAGNLAHDDETYSVLAKMDREGRLPVRYEGVYHVYLPEHLDNAISEFHRLRSRYTTENLTFHTIKIHYDGIKEIRTAGMSEEYLDDPGNKGGILVEQDKLTQFIRDINDEEIDLHIHVVGDEATTIALNAYETVKKELGDKLYTRLTLCHLEIIKPEDMGRFVELGVVANFTPQWHGDPMHYLDAVIGERNKRVYVAQPLLESGATVSFSSDVISPAEWERANPFLGMQVAHNRQDLEGGVNAPLMEPVSERLTLEALLTGYTRSGAYQLRRENSLGMIKEGMSADFVVMNDDLFTMDRYKIAEAEANMTVKDGEVVFKRTWLVNVQEWIFDLMY